MILSRKWAMPNAETFKIEPINEFVTRHLRGTTVSIDPFARNSQLCSHTNDLNPNTDAQHHMKALDFLLMLKDQGVQADVIIFDPPYSLRQVKEVYESVGVGFMAKDSRNAVGWYAEKNVCESLLSPVGKFLHFGWHTNGMGIKRGFSIAEILMVAHGRCHHDTLCMAEQREGIQLSII